MNPNLLWYIPLLPFLGFLLNGTIGRKFPRPLVVAVALFFTAIPAGIVAYLWTVLKAAGAPLAISVVSKPWIAVSGFTVNFAFTVDHLTLLMLSIITGVGFLIHLYSAGYMAHEEGFWRFFAYLNLFMFFMLVLVLSANFLLLFVGWEGVGLASYLLIGFYFTKDSAANAGKKAFVVNRIGDLGLLIAMFLLIANFHTLNFDGVFAQIAANPTISTCLLTAIGFMLLLGATGKSAQIPLYVWLPDAMEGPTPVSALIHAATMVTAGIYMMARCHVILDRAPSVMITIAIIGAVTALMAATIGLVQHDIKRVLAYSTVSQLGYMVLACGVGAYTAGVFHLMTHAFFKALLFLAAGSVIHAVGGEQDMRKMGGLRSKIPVTFWTMTIGVFTIAGAPLLAAFFSKDEILYQAFISPSPVGKLVWLIGVITAGLTSFYMFRLWFKTFFGAPRFEEATDAHHGHHDAHAGHGIHVHESPLVMTLPLMILAVLSALSGFLGVPEAFGGHDEFGHFLAPVLSSGEAEHAASAASPILLASVSVAMFAVGLLVAWQMYYRKPGTGAALAAKLKPVYSLLDHKYWVDEIYGTVIVAPLAMISRFGFGAVESGVVQGVPTAGAGITRGVGAIARRMQSGNIRSYAGWLALGAAVILFLAIFTQVPVR
ncbi:NADH-quinone oxidoreductase subunit L [Granulicella cerasi]|uniref:NADH-quinone oxidoreductase subunit L n=1 Tax=Granulicella cerasi TaxID=741063 RepID=A0ABW1Z5C1_9BACT|nr:NADH-quinone oxidoreductase subunit L [Granulicella cerasi]